jgi:hypothetical protein
MTTVRAGLGLLLLCATAAQEKPKKGSFRTVFDERHELGLIKEIAARFNWSMDEIRDKDPKAGAYDPKDEYFQVCVPDGYSADAPHGLLVWIGPYEGGSVADDWKEVLARKKLIAIGPEKAGSKRQVWYRMSLALDAVHNMKKRYAIDPKRIYVAGEKTAVRMTHHWPDVFTGGIYMKVFGFYLDIPFPDDPKRYWPALFARPRDSLLKKAKQDVRHVLLMGDQDRTIALPHARASYERIRKTEGFSHFSYLEMPGKGDVLIDGKWLEKALDVLDEPLKKEKK